MRLAGALVCLLALAWPAHAAEPALFLSIDKQPARPAHKESSSIAAALTLVLNSLSETRRMDLARALGALSAQVKRRRNPFFAEIGDGKSEAEEMLSSLTPALTAASALLAKAWRSPEDDLEVRLVNHCSPREHCLPLYRAVPRSEEEARARFLAWPWGYSAMALAPSPADAERLASEARAQDSNKVALVLTAHDTRRLRKSPAIEAIRNQARYLSTNLPAGRLADLLADLAHLKNETVPSPRLPRGAVLLVPRLGVLAVHDQFLNEAHGCLAGASLLVAGASPTP